MKQLNNYRLLVVYFSLTLAALLCYQILDASAQTLPSRERLSQVLADAQAQVKEKPGAAEAHYLLGELYALAEDPLAAELAFARVFEIDPHFLPSHYSMGLLYYRVGMYEEASQEFQAFLAANPQNAPGFYNLGVMLQCLGENRAATDAYQTAISIEPAEPAYFSNLSQLQQQGVGK